MLHQLEFTTSSQHSNDPEFVEETLDLRLVLDPIPRAAVVFNQGIARLRQTLQQYTNAGFAFIKGAPNQCWACFGVERRLFHAIISCHSQLSIRLFGMWLLTADIQDLRQLG